MAATPFSSKPTLVGDLVTLRPVRAEDADVIDEIIRTDPEVGILTGSVHSSDEPADDMSLDELREVYGRWAVADDRLVLAVIDNASGQMVGEVVLNDWDEPNRSCGFRTFIGAQGRGRGLGTEATALVVRHGLTTMGLHRIGLEVYAFNPRARHVYEKVGFTHEGTGREALWFDGAWVDVHYMAILADAVADGAAATSHPAPHEASAAPVPAEGRVAFVPIDPVAERDELVAFLTGNEWGFHGVARPTAGDIHRAIAEGAYARADCASYWVDYADLGRIGFLRLEDLGDPTPLFDLRLAGRFRGRGLGVPVLRAATDLLFHEHPKATRFEGHTREDNLAMRRTFQRAGWVQEGHHRDGRPVPAREPRAAVSYAVLRRDWESGTTTPVVWDGTPG